VKRASRPQVILLADAEWGGAVDHMKGGSGVDAACQGDTPARVVPLPSFRQQRGRMLRSGQAEVVGGAT
jgi:hypothetical protein